ncbi:hypothetical protein ACOSQ3_004892 [Xanthoceras sorbifolium]
MDVGPTRVYFASGFCIGTFSLWLHQGYEPSSETLKTFTICLHQGHELSSKSLKFSLNFELSQPITRKSQIFHNFHPSIFGTTFYIISSKQINNITKITKLYIFIQ